MWWKSAAARTKVLLVVLAILSALAVVDQFMGGSRRSPILECKALVNNITYGLQDYAAQHGGVLPPALETLHDLWGEDKQRFRRRLLCPVAIARGLPASRAEYEYVGEGSQTEPLRNRNDVPLVFDGAGNHADGTRTVGFADGHVDTLTEGEFRRCLLRAVQGGCYSQAALERLLVRERWLADQMEHGEHPLAGGSKRARTSCRASGIRRRDAAG